MNPAVMMSHIETKRAALQNLQPEDLRARRLDYGSKQEGFPDMR